MLQREGELKLYRCGGWLGAMCGIIFVFSACPLVGGNDADTGVDGVDVELTVADVFGSD